ncbi:MAG: hypothetical protein LBK02_09420 [Treponema sp.]|nr:hypothetical protein [Treponema sp.]
MARQKEQTPEEFWRDYEQQTGEKVLARSMGRYLSGWDEFDQSGDTLLWGLLILTDRSFRFHHFPQTSWLDALTRFNSGGVPAKEKTFCIPREWINSTELRREKKLWRRLFAPHPPLLIIRYRNGEGQEREILAETGTTAQALADLPDSEAG